MGGGGGGGQNALVGMAMGQASKLFDQQSSQGNLVSCWISVFSVCTSFPNRSQSLAIDLIPFLGAY